MTVSFFSISGQTVPARLPGLSQNPSLISFIEKIRPNLCEYVCMTLYDESFVLPMAFGPDHLSDILGGSIGQAPEKAAAHCGKRKNTPM